MGPQIQEFINPSQTNYFFDELIAARCSGELKRVRLTLNEKKIISPLFENKVY
jgi:hypothetical protein